MEKCPSAQEASERFDVVQKEIEERVYEVSQETHSILAGAIERAMKDGEREVHLVTQGYKIEECWWLVENFLKQQWYQDVSIEEKWYSCFDNNRGQTEIVFSF